MLSGTRRGPVADSVNDEQDVVDGRIGHPEYVSGTYRGQC